MFILFTFFLYFSILYFILYTLYLIFYTLYFIRVNVSPIGLSAINVFATLGPGPVSNQHQIRAIPATRLTPSLSSLTSSSSLSLLTSSLSWSSSSPSSLTSSSSTPVSSSAASTQTQSQSYGNTDSYY